MEPVSDPPPNHLVSPKEGEGFDQIPSARIHYHNVEPLADDGLTLCLRLQEDGIQLIIHHTIGKNLHRALKERALEDKCEGVKGSILVFQEQLTWTRFEQMCAGQVVPLATTLRLKPPQRYRLLCEFLLNQIVRLSITSFPLDIEYALELRGAGELKQRVPHKNCSDVLKVLNPTE